jgi:lipopolysaccharide transport system ATP-binding protein
MSSETVVRVENLGKCYLIYESPQERLAQLLRLKKKPRAHEFWALRGVSFELHRGETVGIIGRNGSGKSTLLQIICGTVEQSEGAVETTGRIGALLELGTGFNPEFSGVENVYLNAAILGLTREQTDAHMDKILAFADIGDFVKQPVKTYSSGMVVRLAFAVQAMIQPDILIVDEALAVGDAKFQAKCFERLRHLKELGTSILLVTHSGEQIVTHCSRAILLDGGRQIEIGEPRRIHNRYMDLLFGRPQLDTPQTSNPSIPSTEEPIVGRRHTELSTSADLFGTRILYNRGEYRWGDGKARILDFCLVAGKEEFPTMIVSGSLIRLSVSIAFVNEVIRPILGCTVRTKEGVTVYGTNSELLGVSACTSAGGAETVLEISIQLGGHLAPGDYFISLGVASRDGEQVVPHDRRYDAIHIVIAPDSRYFGLVNLGATMEQTPQS